MNAEVVAGIFLFEGFRDWMNMQTNQAQELSIRMRTATGPYLDDLTEQERVAGRAVLRIENRVGGVVEQAEMLSAVAGDVAWWTERWLILHPLLTADGFPGVLAYDVWNPLGRTIAAMHAADEPPPVGMMLNDHVEFVRIVLGELEDLLAAFFRTDMA